MYLSSASSRLVLHDVNGWDLKKTYGSHDGIVRDVSWSDDGKYLLQVDPKGLIEILAATEPDIRSLQHVPFKDTWSASFHRDGHRNIGIGTRSGNVLIWDTKNKSISKTFPTPSHQSSVNFVSFNAKNTSLAASMQNGETVIYGLVSNIPVLTIKLACSKSISAMKFHHESRALLGLATDEGHVILRDITTNKDKAFFENVHASPVSDFSYSLVNKDVMLSTGYDKIMHVYDVRLQSVVSTVRTSYTLTSLAINLENQVALGTKHGVILIYDLRDLANPFKVLKGNDEEVRKVCFQPVKKKISLELSLREDVEMSPHKLLSPINNRSSEIFVVSNSPVKGSPPKMYSQLVNQSTGDNKADSFLDMMGLNKSNNDFDEQGNRTADFGNRSDRHELRFQQIIEKNTTKMSTPLTSRNGELFTLPSPLIGVRDDFNEPNNNNVLNLQHPESVQRAAGDVESKTIEELKDFVNLSLSEISSENRSYFLDIMMALTKQKLYLEKQIVSLHEKQDALFEHNRKLAQEIDMLKSQQIHRF